MNHSDVMSDPEQNACAGAGAVDQVVRCLEVCAKRSGDIVPAVYDRFFELSPDAHGLMGHSDRYMQGRMFEQVVGLLMSDEHFGAGGYLDWELDNHLIAYRVQGDMYEAFFQAIIEVVRYSMGSEWQPVLASAWQARTDAIMQQVLAHPAVVEQV